jgi:hypothetical protein
LVGGCQCDELAVAIFGHWQIFRCLSRTHDFIATPARLGTFARCP